MISYNLCNERRALGIAFGFLILALILTWGASASTFTVNGSGSAMYTKIQDAINNASAGDTILVYSGTYYENVDVNKQLILKGIDNGNGKPIVNSGERDNAIMISGGNITLEGFVALNASRVGIYVDSDLNIIKNNSVSSNYQGIFLSSQGAGNVLDGNIASNNRFGIDLISSTKNTLINNVMKGNDFNFEIVGLSELQFDNEIDKSNTVEGKPIYYIKNATNLVYDSSIVAGTLYCISCLNVTIRDMNFNRNSAGIFLYNTNFSRIINIIALDNYEGIVLESSNNNTLINNNASNNYATGIVLSSSNNNSLSSNVVTRNTNGVYLFSSTNNKLNDTISFYNSEGVSMYNSINNLVIANRFSHNFYSGIYMYGNGLWNNKHNTLKDNIISDNNFYGIVLLESPDNVIYNNLFNNTANFGFSSIFQITNHWNISKTNGSNIINNPYLGGNFWANPSGTGFSQTCIDGDKDGICDSPYILDSSNTDYLPLANNTVGLPKTGDINGDGKLTLVDAIYLAKHVGGFSGYETIYADGDINADGKVTLVDAIYLAKHVGGFIGYEKIY